MNKTSPSEREAMDALHRSGKTYAEIAELYHLSKECVRYWCRKQRDGESVQTVYPHRQLLEHFDPRVSSRVHELKEEHRKWGPKCIRFHLTKEADLQGLRLPSQAQIGRYLHQWEEYRRPPKQDNNYPPPPRAKEPHERWQIDFKIKICLGGELTQLFTATDEASGVCIGAWLFPNPSRGPKLADVYTFLRYCFSRWNVVPQEIRTDGEGVLVGRAGDLYFPPQFTLWLAGLGIQQRINPSRKPTCNAEVERCHRTVNEYAVVGNEQCDYPAVNQILEQATHELAYELPSRGKDCHNRPPVTAYPELLDPHRPYHWLQEQKVFSLERMDRFLADKTWLRKVGKTGQIAIGEGRQYSIGRQHANKHIWVKFDPQDRHFVFYEVQEKTSEPGREIGRKPAKGLELEDIFPPSETVLIPFPLQLPLQLVWAEGVNGHE